MPPVVEARSELDPRDTFLRFNYPELKDLGKHSLTISSATVVFLVTFMEKIIGATSGQEAPTAPTGALFRAALIGLLVALVSAGTGLFTNYVAGAGASGGIILGIGRNFKAVTRVTYGLYLLAGTCLIGAFALLAVLGLFNLGPRELGGQPCIAREPGSATRRLVEGWLRRSRVRLDPAVEVRCPEAAKVLVRAGLGFSYISAAGLEGDRGRGLRVLRFDGRSLARPIFLVHHADKRLSPPMEAFIAMCGAALGSGGAAKSR